VSDEPNVSAMRLALGRARHERGWTYDELAEASGVSRRSVVAIEVGTSGGTIDSWWRLSRALGFTFSELALSLEE
jgi:putative transcriptional regulator